MGDKLYCTVEEGFILYRREGKDRRCCLGDVLEFRTSHLAGRKDLEKTFIMGEWWFGGVVLTRLSSIFSSSAVNPDPELFPGSGSEIICFESGYKQK